MATPALGGALAVQRVGVSYGDAVAVAGVSFELAAGRVLAVLGPSGCGKSTLLRAIAGLEPLVAGSVGFDGVDLAGVPTYRRGFGLVFQDGQLFTHLSVGANIAYGLRGGSRRRDSRARAAELLDLVGLKGYADRLPATLSGGERQRVALARSLAPQPRLLLLDEPLSSLDRELRERLCLDVRDILVRTSTTAMFVTHDHDEALTISDDLAVMRGGRLVQHGATEEVWRRPADVATARFLGYATVLEGRAAAALLDLLGLAGPSRGDEPIVALRRSAVRVDPAGRVRATVVEHSPGVDLARCVLDVAGMGSVHAVAGPADRLVRGDSVTATFDATGIAVLPAPGCRDAVPQ